MWSHGAVKGEGKVLCVCVWAWNNVYCGSSPLILMSLCVCVFIHPEGLMQTAAVAGESQHKPSILEPRLAELPPSSKAVRGRKGSVRRRPVVRFAN